LQEAIMPGPEGYSQENRPIRLDTPLGEDVLLLEKFAGFEGISQQYVFQLDAVSTEASLSLDDLLQKPVVVSLRMVDDDARFFHGIVSRAMQLERAHGLTSYRLEIVPWTWFLSLTTDCRIFEDKTTQQIIEQIFQEQEFTDYDFRLTGSYEPREYCVQYRETSLNFVSRLMEEEGIFYFFEHTKDKHTLILADAISSFEPCPGNPTVRYGIAPTASQEDDLILTLSREHAVRSRTISLTDYDFQKPKVKLDVRATSARFDIYDYPGRYLARDLGERYAKIRLEEQEVARVTISGSSNCRHFVAGYRFTLDDTLANSSDPFVLLSVAHSASANSFRSDREESFVYENRFHAFPADVPFRPPRVAPKPLVQGTQTAVVVGQDGEEIWVDKYGRIKVHFFWDREDKSSCWVRVSQTWAGKVWGSIHTPRIGQEVVVDFLEGDPDRPIVIGRIYNAEQMPPYDLPADQTISGTKSRSSKDGSAENYNELIFEDKKGEEFIRIHAEKDMQEYVEQTSYEYVGQDRHLIVDGSQAESVKGDKHLTVKGAQNEDIGSASLNVKQDHNAKVGTVYTVDAGQEVHVKGGMKVIVESGLQLSLIGAGGFVDIGPAGVTIQGIMVKINSGGSAGSGTASNPTAPKDPKKAS
jgi:type VI secretion system secreted protein VgrG